MGFGEVTVKYIAALTEHVSDAYMRYWGDVTLE